MTDAAAAALTSELTMFLLSLLILISAFTALFEDHLIVHSLEVGQVLIVAILRHL